MADYQQMYTVLFRAVTQAITILQDAQCLTEELYLSADEPNIMVLHNEDETAETMNSSR